MLDAIVAGIMLLMAELDCLAHNIYFEARNQPLEGQLAVAKVTLNRAESARWPDSVCSVVSQPYQFSWVRHEPTPKEKEALYRARMLAIASPILPDPTYGATHFHASYVEPEWASSLQIKAIIGDHIFYD